MGLPGAGKSTLAQSLVAEGYMRLNRDETGGSLNGLLPALDRAILSGSSRIVLDNTYVSRKARGAVIQAARDRGIPVRCVWISTSVEDSQINAVSRIVSRYGPLLGPDELRTASRKDVAAFGPTVQFRYQRELEPPDPSEGFSQRRDRAVRAPARSLVRQPGGDRLVRWDPASQSIDASNACVDPGCRGIRRARGRASAL